MAYSLVYQQSRAAEFSALIELHVLDSGQSAGAAPQVSARHKGSKSILDLGDHVEYVSLCYELWFDDARDVRVDTGANLTSIVLSVGAPLLHAAATHKLLAGPWRSGGIEPLNKRLKHLGCSGVNIDCVSGANRNKR